MIRLVRYLRSHHVPLDGVGHEMHNHIDNPSPYSMYYAIHRIHKLFPHLHEQVTELDMSVYSASDNTSNYGADGGSVPESLIAEQGWLYKDYFDEFRALKGKLDAVTFWGMADDDTWLDSFPIDRLDRAAAVRPAAAGEARLLGHRRSDAAAGLRNDARRLG